MKQKVDFTEQQKQLARIAKALSHPARVYIMERLSELNSCCTSGEMIGEIPIARSTLSRHLKELKYAGLIQGEIEPPKIKYCINKENWEMTKKLFNEFFK
ncbi:MAG TPA: helix-turn-helix domain-containing protein [Bacteroidales bacterium]|nr:helix-turn-helix domain-containing protein [Bacteroidales bacterium]